MITNNQRFYQFRSTDRSDGGRPSMFVLARSEAEAREIEREEWVSEMDEPYSEDLHEIVAVLEEFPVGFYSDYYICVRTTAGIVKFWPWEHTD